MQQLSNTSVLITGESGTGKELVARAIHFGSARRKRPFVPVNCAAISAELAESALFGHTVGAFTGAVKNKKGVFDMADGGTLFLDEIGDMPLALQGKLLRVLEDGLVTPVGGECNHAVNVRVLSATNAPIAAFIEKGTFREDLYYRLAAFFLHLPPLRDRTQDIVPLARHFGNRLSSEMGLANPQFAPEALKRLSSYRYPGNVRELRNVIERALIESAGGTIETRHLQFPHVSAPSTAETTPQTAATEHATDLPLDLAKAQAVLIRRALVAAKGNVSEAARLLGINRTKLYRMMAALLPD